MSTVSLVNETEFHVVAVGPVQIGTVAGVPGVSAWQEPVSVWNNGSPEIVFNGIGEVVMSDAS